MKYIYKIKKKLITIYWFWKGIPYGWVDTLILLNKDEEKAALLLKSSIIWKEKKEVGTFRKKYYLL